MVQTERAVLLTASQDRLAGVPGGPELEVVLSVCNQSESVDQFDIQIDGLDRYWYTLKEPLVSLFPGDQSKATLLLKIPEDARAGRRRFEVVARSRGDDPVSSRLPMVVEVAVAGTFSADLVPRRATGHRGAQYTLLLHSESNADRLVDIAVTDPAEAMRFHVRPEQVVVPAGGTADVEIGLRRSVAWFQRGAVERFNIAAAISEGALALPDVELSGEFQQLAMLPWAPGLAGLIRRLAVVVVTLAMMAIALIWVLGQPGSRPYMPINPAVEPTPGENIVVVDADGNPVNQDAAANAGEAGGAAGGAATGGAAAGGAGAAGASATGGGSASAPGGAAAATGAGAAPGASAATDGSAAPATGAASGTAGAAPSPTPDPRVRPPVVSRFGVNPPADGYSSSIPLSWDVQGATQVEAAPSLPSAGPPQPAPPVQRVEYTLTASNAGGTTTSIYTVFILRPPVIDSFQANAKAINLGQPVRLSWSITRATLLFLDDQPLKNLDQVDQIVKPTSTHTFELRAENPAGSVIKSLVVIVHGGQPPANAATAAAVPVLVSTTTPSP